jgi:hypothetical protein
MKLPSQRLTGPVPDSRSRVVFFNSSNRAMYGIDKTGRIDIRIDGAALGTVDIGEYVQTFLPKGDHQVELRHRDTVWMKSNHRLAVDRQAKWVRVYCQVFSNGLKATDQPPPSFSADFRPARAD